MKPLPLRKYIPLVKVDEGTHTAYGLVTSESEDCEGEICDFTDSVPYYQKWSQAALDATTASGQDLSLGNIRLMHQLIIAGKVVKLDIKTDSKQIFIGSQPVNDDVWRMVKGGFIRGYSQGGGYGYRRCNVCKTDIPANEDGSRGFYCPSCASTVKVRYSAVPSEVSYVDNPAVSTATFSYVKADGSIELRKFQSKEEVVDMDKEVVESLTKTLADNHRALVDKFDAVLGVKKANESKTKRVAGEDLGPSAFAFVGDKNDTSTWKLPIHFSSEEKSKRHVRNALARFGQTQGIPEGEKAKVKAKIDAAAKRYGIDAGDAKKAERAVALRKSGLIKSIPLTKTKAELAKSLSSVGGIISCLQTLNYIKQDCEWESIYENGGEGDPRDEALAVEVQAAMEHLIEILKDTVDEETSELLTNKAAKSNQGDLKMAEKTTKAVSMKEHFGKAAEYHKNMSEADGEMMEAMKASTSSPETFGKMAECYGKSAKAHSDYSAHLGKMASDAKDDDADDKEKAKKMADMEEAAKAAAAAKAAPAVDMAKTITDAVTAGVVAALAKSAPAAVVPVVETKTEPVVPVVDPTKMDDMVKAAVEAHLAKRMEAPPANFHLFKRDNGTAAFVPVTSDSDTGI